MRIVLVNPPKTHWERDEIAPPLGLLRLAEIAIRAGAGVAIEDYNLLYHLLPDLRDDFYAVASERLLELDADVYGFTSMAVDSHVALELARQLKILRPGSFTIFGGPHFSSRAEDVLQRYPWVDHVVSGEGEGPFENFAFERVNRGNRTAVSADQSSLRLPELAYSIVNLSAYFHVNPTHVFNYEPNRGCRYKCTFCYSPGFYGSARDLGVDGVVADLAALQQRGAKRVFFVGDNLLNNHRWAHSLCAALQDARLGLDWYCYATLPDLSDELARQMARAGCSQVFMGIDVVGATSERHFHKAFARRETDLERKIRVIREAGITSPTCGFILCPPSHPASKDWSITIQAALAARRAGADVLFNVLNIYSGTETEQSAPVNHMEDSLQAKLLLDVPLVVQNNQYALDNPAGFPFHSRYVPEKEWHDFLQMAHCLHTLVNLFPMELGALVEEQGITPVQFVHRVVERTGELLCLEPEERRACEEQHAVKIFKELNLKWLYRDNGGEFSTSGQGF